MGLLTRLDRFLVKFEEVLLALLLVSLIVLAATQVLLRNIWSTSIDWADVTLQNATVLIALLGAAIATSEGRHLNIDLVGRTLRGRRRLALNVLIGIFGVIICALLTRGGWQTYRANFEPWLANVPAGWSTMRLLQQELSEGSFPQWLSQLMLPFGFGLIGLHFFLRLARDLSWLVGGEDGSGQGEEHEGDRYLDYMVASAEEEEEQPSQDEVGEESPRQAPSVIEQPRTEEEVEEEEQDARQTRPLGAGKLEDEQEDATTAAMTPKHRKELGAEAAIFSKEAPEPREAPRVSVSAELEEATISDALSDTLVPEAKVKEDATISEVEADTEAEEDEGETLFDPDLQDQLATPAEKDLADATTELARVRTDVNDVAEAATELAVPRADDDGQDDDEEERR